MLKIRLSKCQLYTYFQATSGPWYDTEELNSAVLEVYSGNPLYEYRAVPGPHHVHLSSPEVVAEPILTFLARNKDRLEGGSKL